MLVQAPLRAAMRSLLSVGVVTATGLSLLAWIAAPHAWQPAGVAAASVLAPLGAVLLVPIALRPALTPKRPLRGVLLGLAACGVALAVAAGRRDLTAASLVCLFATLAAFPLWPELSDVRARREGWGLLLGATTAVSALFLMDRPPGQFTAVLAFILIAALAAAVWGLFLLGRHAPLEATHATALVRPVYEQHAGAGVSPFALMADKRHFWSNDGKAFLAYASRAGVNVVLGPGIGPSQSLPGLNQQFREECRRRGWEIAFYQVAEPAGDGLGFGVRYRIGSEAIVDLNALTLDGPSMADLRHEVSRGRRHGVTVSVTPENELAGETRSAIDAIAATWARRHALGEMAFSVGRRSDKPDVPTTVGLAYDGRGHLAAYTTWLWLPAAAGVVLDEVRRLPGAPAGAMDLLLFTCMDQFRGRATWASLGVAPLAGAAQAGRLARLESFLLRQLGISTASATLYSFKGKYQPRWEPRYMVVERFADWPAAILAGLLLHYPSIEERCHRLVPSRLRSLPSARLTLGASATLLATGLTGIVAATFQSHEGHPLYPLRAAIQTPAHVLPLTGPSESRPTPTSAPTSETGRDSAGDR